MELVTVPPLQVIAWGEAMLEVSGGPEAWRLGAAGDTLNAAIGLARLGVATGYMTALGDDPFSDDMLAAVRGEGLDVSGVLRLPGALPGLYAIRTDADGERGFFYWRRDSAARRFFDAPGADAALAAAGRAPWLLLSGISLAVLHDARGRVAAALDGFTGGGGRLIFDPNHRQALWPDAGEARAAYAGVLSRAALALPTFADEQALFGDADPAACAARIRALGTPEVVVKLGAGGCLVSDADGQAHVPVPAVARPVDTSGAGDAFNAGYIAARIAGRAPRDAALAGHRMAAVTLAHRGAVPPRAAVRAEAVLA